MKSRSMINFSAKVFVGKTDRDKDENESNPLTVASDMLGTYCEIWTWAKGEIMGS
jgi:hypothetical protein